MPCKVCGKSTQREATSKGFKDYCGHACMQKWRWVNGKRDRNASPFSSPEVQAKSRKTNLERYGAEYHMQNPEHAKKWKEEYKEKTGYETALNNPTVRKKINNTVKDKYGVDYISQSPEIKARIKASMGKIGRHWQLTEDEKEKILSYRKQHYVSDAVVADETKVAGRSAVSIVLREAGFEPGSTSKPEFMIRKFIQHRFPNWKLSCRNRQIIAPLEIDIYIPEIKTGIEMNGLYWHANRERYHYDKFKKAQAAGVSLLQIWDTECDLHHMRILQSMIKCRAGLAQRIPARKCKIIEMDVSIARAFYEYNHWNGFLPSERHFGLTYNTRLVAAMSMSKSRYRKGYTEITRCCSRLNCVVMGGVDKLIQHVEKECNSPLVSYSDNRLFSGESFKKNGFDLERDDSIGYFWFKQDGSFLKRYQTQKHKLSKLLGDGFDPNETETQNMEANGWEKVYDAGQSVWTKEIPATYLPG